VRSILDLAGKNWSSSPLRFREVLAFAARGTKRRLEARLASLAVISQVSPLIGLLGTVMGMVRAFLAVQQSGGEVDPSSLAGGIWEALLTTVFGLCVAIPAYLAWHGLEHLVQARLEAVEDLTEALLTVHQETRHAVHDPAG
jgi:biopolymer transport protein ExbB